MYRKEKDRITTGSRLCRAALCLLACWLNVLFLFGCIGEGLPDPEPQPGEPPVIHEFQRQKQDGSWEPTVEGAVGTTIGIVGENFGEDETVLEVFFNGVPAPIEGLEPTNGSDLVRIVTVVPEGATTGPVVVRREGIASQGVIFYLVLFVNASKVMDILFEETGVTDNGQPASSWLATQGGGLLHVNGDFDRLETGNHERYTTIDGLLSLNPLALLQDPEGRILAGTLEAGLNIKGEAGFVNFTTDNGLPINGILSLYLTERSGDLLMGTANGLVVWRNYRENAGDYLDRIDPRSGAPLSLEDPPWEFYLRHRWVSGFLEEPDKGRLLVAAHNGIYEISYWELADAWNYLGPRRLYPLDDDDREGCWPYFTSLQKDKDGRLLAGSLAEGLFVFENSMELEDPEILFDEIERRGITEILTTKLGNSYFITSTLGLWQVDRDEEGRAVVSSYQPDTNFFALRASPADGRIYLGMISAVMAFEEDAKGPVAWQQWTFPRVMDGNNIHCLAPDGTGGVFIGSRDMGLTRFNGDLSAPSFVRVPPIMPDTVPRQYESYISALSPVPGESGKVYVGTSRGLGKLDYTSKEPWFEPLLEWDHGVHMVSQILPVTTDQILLGTLVDGLLQYSDQHGTHESLSTGTRFQIHAEDFFLSEFSFLVPVTAGGGDLVEWTVSDLRPNPDHHDPAGGVVNLFTGEDKKVYAHLDSLSSLEICNASSGGNLQGALFFKGTLQGGEQAGDALTLELQDMIGGVQTEWWAQGPTNNIYVWSLLDLIIAAHSEPLSRLGPPASFDFSVDEDRSGVYFLAFPMDHLEGAFSTTFETYPLPQEGPSPTYFITSLLEGEMGSVLIGTEEDGLFIYDPEEPDAGFRHYTKQNYLDQWPAQISALAKAPDGDVFVGTFQEGLYKLKGYTTDTPSITRMGTGQGELPTQNITALESFTDSKAAGTSYLLVGVYDTLDRFNTGITVYRLLEGAEKGEYRSLNASDGLIPARIQDILMVGEDLYMGTTQGLCVIQQFPSLVKTLFNREPP